MSRIPAGVTLILAALLVGACQDGGGEVIGIDATGTVVGLAWVDLNGTGTLEGSDAPGRDIRVELRSPTGGRVLYSATTGSSGAFSIPDVLVGDYVAVVDPGSVGDTLQVLSVDSSHVAVSAGDTTRVLIGLTYPATTIDSARSLPHDQRIFVHARVISAWNTFGDAAMHVRDSTGAVRLLRVAGNSTAVGDSVRVVGTTGVQAGQLVLRDAQVFLLRTGVESPVPDTVTTQEAASAGGGMLDAELVRVDSAAVQDTSRTAAGDLVVTIDDGSGPVDVVLDAQLSFFFQFEGPFIGRVIRVTGVLVPTSAGGPWMLKPRSNSDVSVGPLSYPTVPIATARTEPPDTRLIINGRALTRWNNFGDATVHVRDSTGSIRAIQVPQTTINAGDSIRVLGTTTTVSGQPVLYQVWTSISQVGTSPPSAVPITTVDATSARQGTLDAALVRVSDAVVQDTTRNNEGELTLLVDDGSGQARIVFDSDIPFSLSWPQQDGQTQVIGSIIDATGLLIPRAQGSAEWVLKPRASSDVDIRSGG